MGAAIVETEDAVFGGTAGRAAGVGKPPDRSRRDVVLDRFLSGSDILGVGFLQHGGDAGGRRPNTAFLDLGDSSRLRLSDESQDAVLADHALEHIADYRAAVSEWFRLLRIGGHLIVTVPHQFLFERKLFPPSRFDPGHRRFYTSASLLAEIEEALDPLSYRVRHLEEDDAGFDYGIPPERDGGGHHEIIAVIQRIRRPDYADAVMHEAVLTADESHFMRQVTTASREPVVAIESSPAGIERVIVLKLDHRGDFLMAKRGFETLRAQFPATHITLACGPWNAADAERLGVFDRVIGFDFFPEVASHVLRAYTADEAAARFTTSLAGETFDLAIDLRVDEDTRPLLLAVDARYRAGFGTPERFPFLDIALPLINPTLESRAYRRLLKAEQFGTRIGHHEGFAITNGRRRRRRPPGEILTFGPYERFEAGYWELDVLIEPSRAEFEIGYDVVISSGNEPLGFGSLDIRSGTRPRVALLLETSVEGLEFRMKVGRSGSVEPFRFFGCLATKRGSLPALHQEEMQAMLAYLAGLRMQHPTLLREVPA